MQEGNDGDQVREGNDGHHLGKKKRWAPHTRKVVIYRLLVTCQPPAWF